MKPSMGTTPGRETKPPAVSLVQNVPSSDLADEMSPFQASKVRPSSHQILICSRLAIPRLMAFFLFFREKGNLGLREPLFC